MELNFKILLAASLIPLVIGFVWYNPKVFGTAWMNATGMTEEKAKGANMPLIFGLTFVFSFMFAFILQTLVIHQFSVFSLMANEPSLSDPNSEVGKYFADFMSKYGNNFRSFKHGVLHGVITGLFLILPVIGVNALFERKGFKYIAINVGYWILSSALMGGVICAFA